MSNPDLIEILANLDFFVQGPKTKSLQDENYPKHKDAVLEDIAKNVGGRVSISKIRKTLWQAIRVRECYPDHAFDLLLFHGSSELHLDFQSRTAIDTHLQLLRLQGRQRLQAGGMQKSQRWLRSAVSARTKQQNAATSSVSKTRSQTRSMSSTSRVLSKVCHTHMHPNIVLTYTACPQEIKT